MGRCAWQLTEADPLWVKRPAVLFLSVYKSWCGAAEATLPRNKGDGLAETHLYLSHFACCNRPPLRSCTDVTSIFSRGLDVNQLYGPNGSLPLILALPSPPLPGFDCLPTVTLSSVTSLHPSTLLRCHPAVGGKEENESWELSARARGGFFLFFFLCVSQKRAASGCVSDAA